MCVLDTAMCVYVCVSRDYPKRLVTKLLNPLLIDEKIPPLASAAVLTPDWGR